MQIKYTPLLFLLLCIFIECQPDINHQQHRQMHPNDKMNPQMRPQPRKFTAPQFREDHAPGLRKFIPKDIMQPDHIFGIFAGSKDQSEIKLYGIIPPAKNNLAYSDCLETLKSKLLNQLTSVKEFGRDKKGNIIGEIQLRGENINKALIKMGLAKIDPQVPTDDNIKFLEQMAKKNKLGLWQYENIDGNQDL